MDISSMASKMTDMLKQYLAQHSQAYAPSAEQGQQPDKLQELYALVKNKLSGQPESATTLQAFEQAPEQHADALQGALAQHLSNDPGFLAQVADHLKKFMPGAADESLLDKAKGEITDLFGGKGEKAA